MNALYSRNAGWVLLIVAVLVLSWTLDQRDANQLAQQANQALVAQLSRSQQAHRPSVPASSPVAAWDAAALAARAQQWREAAANQGGDARNAAAALARVRGLCEKAKLPECNVRLSTQRHTDPLGSATAAFGLAAASSPSAANSPAGSSSAEQLAPYAVNVVARFDAAGVQDFFQRLSHSGWLYRIERVNIVQNRAEWDLLIFMLNGDSEARALNKESP